MTDKTKFRPVSGTDAQIESAPKSPGWVYFAKDTGKIYYDVDPETRISMGGNGVAIHYGIADANLLPDPDYEDGSYYILTTSDLLNEEDLVGPNDLIFNSDGTFYKVIVVDGYRFYCQKVAVAGGGGGTVSVAKIANLKLITPENVSLINGQDISIDFIATSQIETDGTILDDKLTVSWSLAEKVGSSYITYHNGTSFLVDHGVRSTLSFGEYLRESTTTRITISAVGANSGETPVRSQEFTTSELLLTPSNDFSTLAVYDKDNVNVWCNVSGNMNKILDYYFDGNLVKTVRLNPTAQTAQNYLIPQEFCTHGYHTVRIELYQAVGSSLLSAERALSVEPLEFEIAVKEAGNTTPIIWLGQYQSEYYNYDDIKIPFLVYDPESSEKTKVYLWKNGLPTASPEREVPASSYTRWNEFEIVDADLDMSNYYSISCGRGEREVRRDITFTVSQDPNRTMEVVKQDYLQLLFDAKGRSNSESTVNRKNWKYNRGGTTIQAEFTDFNWYNNGWVVDSEGNSCLRISNGAQFSIPIGPTTFASGSTASQSHSFEFQFKIKNVQDYSELIQNITRYVNDDIFYTAFTEQSDFTNYDAFLQYYLPIYEVPDGQERMEYDNLEFASVFKKISLDKVVCGYYSGNENSATGLCLGSQDAFFSNGLNTVNVSYVENEMVYLSIVYDHQPTTNSSRIYIYINGVLTGAIKSTQTSSFTINQPNLVFNSEYCDIDLYKIRIYNTALSVNDIVMNYAVDTKDINTYDLNGLAIENTAINEYQLSYQKMIEYNNANPSKYIMPYIVFDTSESTEEDRLPWSKSKKFPINVIFKNTGLDYAYASGELEELAIADGLCGKDASPEEKVAAVKQYYLHHCPSWTGNNVEITVQGTSSQFYPRRNYKLKAKTKYDSDKKERVHFFLNSGPYQEDFIIHGMQPDEGEYKNPCHSDWFYMDNYHVGTNKFTMKIDYMESSGSYNAGFANLVATAYTKHPLDDYINKGLIIDNGGFVHTDSLRTSVKGYPVLAFHKKSDGSYTYIGRYNMLLDKGSDENYGFKTDKSVLSELITDDSGQKKKLRDVAECWEFRNNARGYCSFRDPWNRRELSFTPPAIVNGVSGTPGLPGNGYTANGAPLVADSFEYRYHTEEDLLDLVYELSGATAETLYDVGKFDNKEQAVQKFYEVSRNWEKACQWVWSTCIDENVCNALKVPHQGTYEKINVGKVLWEPNKFYILAEIESEEGTETQYILDDSDAWNSEIIYYVQDTKGNYVNAYASEYIYSANTYYTLVNGAYILDRNENMDESVEYYRLNEYTDQELQAMKEQGEVYELPSIVHYGEKEYKYDTVEYRSDKFVYELKDHFDIDYLATYFVMTEVFECYDSRGKNCMMASWGPQAPGGDYIWYPIFYDIDTQLGINNTGIPSFEYSVDATEAGNFSTSDSVLWNNFYKNFKSSYILQKYRQLKGLSEGIGSFSQITPAPLSSVNRIENWYKANPEASGSISMRGQKPLIAINLDEYYKYLTIYNGAGISNGSTGRIDDQGQYIVETTDYLYALQGDRSLSRIQFLTNRIEYIDSWLNVGNYQRGGSNRLWGRVSANNTKTSDCWLDTEADPYYDEFGNKRHEFDAEYWMTLTPIHDSYVTLSDDNEAYPSKKFTGTPIKFEISALENGFRKSQNYPEQLLYVYGMNQMKDIGDLSKQYWTEFKIEGDAKKLTKLKLGHDGYMTNNANQYVDINGNPISEDNLSTLGVKWRNEKMNPPSIPSSKNLVGGGMPLLKEVNVSNITINKAVGSPALDLTSCEKLENFRATESNFEDIQFAEGVALNTLYLPNTVKAIKLTEAKLLTNIIENYTVPTKNAAGELVAVPGLFVDGLTNVPENELSTKGSAIGVLSLVGDAFGYDSYKLLYKYFKLRHSNPEESRITMTDVKWSPYELLVEGDTYNPEDLNLYFIDDGHYGLKPIGAEVANFDSKVLNGEVYKKNPALESQSEMIDSVEIFRDMIDIAKYKSATGAAVPNITGIVYINNTEPVDEIWVRRVLALHYPNLTFIFKSVNRAKSAKFVLPNLSESGAYLGTYSYVPFKSDSPEKSIQKIDGITKTWFENPYNLYEPIKPNYDFLGWSTSVSADDIVASEDWDSLSLQEGVEDYIFYAIFEVHKYDIKFYVGSELIHSIKVPYGDPLVDPGIVPAYSDSSLAEEEKYKFLGYSQKQGLNIVETEAMAKPVNFATLISVQDYNFYAIFTKDSVYNSPLSNDYFNFGLYEGRGYSMTLKSGIKLEGKITLPSTYKGLPILALGGFNGQTELTHVFWHGSPQLEIVLESCFGNQNLNLACVKLEYFQFPTTLKSIQNGAFRFCGRLKYFEFSALRQLQNIGSYAFNQAFIGSVSTFNLPGSVQELGEYAFGNMNISVINAFNIGNSGDPSNLSIVGQRSMGFFGSQGAMRGRYVFYTDNIDSMREAVENWYTSKQFINSLDLVDIKNA